MRGLHAQQEKMWSVALDRVWCRRIMQMTTEFKIFPKNMMGMALAEASVLDTRVCC